MPETNHVRAALLKSLPLFLINTQIIYYRSHTHTHTHFTVGWRVDIRPKINLVGDPFLRYHLKVPLKIQLWPHFNFTQTPHIPSRLDHLSWFKKSFILKINKNSIKIVVICFCFCFVSDLKLSHKHNGVVYFVGNLTQAYEKCIFSHFSSKN